MHVFPEPLAQWPVKDGKLPAKHLNLNQKKPVGQTHAPTPDRTQNVSLKLNVFEAPPQSNWILDIPRPAKLTANERANKNLTTRVNSNTEAGMVWEGDGDGALQTCAATNIRSVAFATSLRIPELEFGNPLRRSCTVIILE